MKDFVQGWYVIYTKPNREKKIANDLSLKAIEYYLPMARSLRQWRDRTRIITAPIFPGYIFVNILQSAGWLATLSIDGVCYFIKNGNELARVSGNVIDQIRRALNSGHSITISREEFKPRQSVTVKRGGLKGLSGEVISHKGKEKVLIRVSLLNRNILVELPLHELVSN